MFMEINAELNPCSLPSWNARKMLQAASACHLGVSISQSNALIEQQICKLYPLLFDSGCQNQSIYLLLQGPPLRPKRVRSA
jgi:hypothetical protein